MGMFPLALVLAAFPCSLVAGFLFAFAVVAMPGIRNLGDREFIRAFQVMDRVIQNNQPVFILVWVGSMVAMAAAVLLGLGQLGGAGRLLMILAALVYFLGVQYPTFAINIPLNNRFQALEPDTMDDRALGEARKEFEPRWNRWSAIRTMFACAASGLLIILVLRH